MGEIWQSRSSNPYSGPLFDRLLNVRGVSNSADREALLAPRLKDLKDPLLLDDMDLAVDRLIQAYRLKEPVAIYADFDLDGTSGLALLEVAFKELGFEKVHVHQPLRLSEGYGLHVSSIQSLAEMGVKVIVTVDVGITAFEAAAECRRLGVDLLITDHHLPKERLPDAMAIVNPNKGTCGSELGHLSGVGVAFYLAWALGREMKSQGLLSVPIDLKALLDVYVIGTLTDLVPLRDENRVLIKHGLIQLERTKRPLLKALLRELGLEGRPLSSSDVAMQIAPKLNALSRLEIGLKPRDVLSMDFDGDLQSTVRMVLESNELRKELQAEALVKARELASLQQSLPFSFVWEASFHKGVVGLIATQLSRDLQKPSFVGHLDEKGQVHGSARLPDGSSVNLAEVLADLQKHVIRAGGHAAAAGFVCRVDCVGDLMEALESRLNSIVPTAVARVFDVDAELPELDVDFMSLYEQLEPFGKDFPTATFRVSSVRIADRRELRGGHLKFKLEQRRAFLDALAFGPSAEALELQIGENVDALVEPQWNHFRGQRQIQLLVRSIKRSST